jgi:hypothetical protein
MVLGQVEELTTKDNESRVRRFYEEVWNKGNLDMADEESISQRLNE